MTLYHKIPATFSVYQKNSLLFLNSSQSEGNVFIQSYVSFIHVTLPKRREKGPNRGPHRKALPQGQYTFHFAQSFSRKKSPFHVNVASSLRALSTIYRRPITSPPCCFYCLRATLISMEESIFYLPSQTMNRHLISREERNFPPRLSQQVTPLTRPLCILIKGTHFLRGNPKGTQMELKGNPATRLISVDL